MKIALIFNGNINHQTGKFNHVFRRFKALKKREDIQIDIFFLQKKYSRAFLLLNNVKVTPGEYVVKDGLRIKNLWLHLTLWEYLMVDIFKYKDVYCKNQLSQFRDIFKGYDILSTNDTVSSYLAHLVKQKYRIPFVITWHGSDVNVYPYQNKKVFKLTKELMNASDYNLFVSKQLRNASNHIAKREEKGIYYIGPGSNFYKKSDQEKAKLRQKYGLHKKYVIGFVGNMIPVKNVLVLPDILKIVKRKLESVDFIFVGDGELLSSLKKGMINKGLKDGVFTGKIAPERVPDVMNTLDVLLLPSINEGLTMVAIEALKCGSQVVGSKVGGIPEIIGEENSIPLGENFVGNMAKRVIQIVKQNEIINAPSLLKFDLYKAIAKEIKIYRAIVQKSNNF